MESVLARVQEVFHEAFGIDSQLISLETTPSDAPAWDSVGHLDLASRLERVFGISFRRGSSHGNGECPRDR